MKSKPQNFWSTLPKPFFTLAPMANVTDYAFRSMIAKYGRPDVMWTEFVSADGLISAGQKKLLIDLKFSKNEKPIVAQLFTGHPEAMKKAAAIVKKLKFDGLDINLGCPDRAVEKQGGGAALIKNQKLAIEIIQAAREGVGHIQIIDRNEGVCMIKAHRKSVAEEGHASSRFSRYDQNLVTTRKMQKGDVAPIGGKKPLNGIFVNSTKGAPASLHLTGNENNFPVSVKTRIGYNKLDLEWIRALLELRLPALTVHLRTRKEMSDVPAHWEIMPEIIKLRDSISPETLIIGNGDVESVEDGLIKLKKYGGDGAMIGRGIFGKPWLFETLRHSPNHSSRSNGSMCHSRKPRRSRSVAEAKAGASGNPVFKEDRSPEDRLKALLEHTKLFEKTYKNIKNFDVMKKHFKAYVSGWDGAKELRVKLMGTHQFKEVKKEIMDYLKVEKK